MPPTTRAVRAPIVLDRDPRRQSKLLGKFAEYIHRSGFPKIGSETDPDDYMRCMLIILLFAYEVVDLDAFEAQNRNCAWFDPMKFTNASEVVRQYNDGLR
jgi:hypothetical protein